MAYAKTQDYSYFLETILRRLMEEDVTQEQIKSILQQLNKPFERYVFIANLRASDTIHQSWMQSIYSLEPLLKSGLICSYKKPFYHHDKSISAVPI